MTPTPRARTRSTSAPTRTATSSMSAPEAPADDRAAQPCGGERDHAARRPCTCLWHGFRRWFPCAISDPAACRLGRRWRRRRACRPPAASSRGASGRAGRALSAAEASSLGEYRDRTNHLEEPRLLLLLDGFTAFRTEYEGSIAAGSAYMLFQRLLAEGRGVGIHVAMTVERPPLSRAPSAARSPAGRPAAGRRGLLRSMGSIGMS